MRDPNRIRKLLKHVEKCLKTNPELTLGKLIDSVAPGNPFLYYVEDTEFNKKLTELYGVEYDDSFDGELENKNLIEIEQTWMQVPDMRFTQLILNLFGDSSLLPYVEDDNLMDGFRSMYGGKL